MHTDHTPPWKAHRTCAPDLFIKYKDLILATFYERTKNIKQTQYHLVQYLHIYSLTFSNDIDCNIVNTKKISDCCILMKRKPIFTNIQIIDDKYLLLRSKNLVKAMFVDKTFFISLDCVTNNRNNTYHNYRSVARNSDYDKDNTAITNKNLRMCNICGCNSKDTHLIKQVKVRQKNKWVRVYGQARKELRNRNQQVFAGKTCVIIYDEKHWIKNDVWVIKNDDFSEYSKNNKKLHNDELWWVNNAIKLNVNICNNTYNNSSIYARYMNHQFIFWQNKSVDGSNYEVCALNEFIQVKWSVERVIWLAFYKNDENERCLWKPLGTDVVRQILKFCCTAICDPIDLT